MDRLHPISLKTFDFQNFLPKIGESLLKNNNIVPNSQSISGTLPLTHSPLTRPKA